MAIYDIARDLMNTKLFWFCTLMLIGSLL